MNKGNDIWLKRIWFINGIILFLLFVLGLIFVTIEFYTLINNGNYNDERGVIIGEEKNEADSNKVELQTITYSTPRKIYGSDIYLIHISQEDYNIPRKVLDISSTASDYPTGMNVNLIFLSAKQNYIKLLLDKKASINDIDYPMYASDSLQKHIYYEISLKDTDGNGRINSSDKNEYFISNLDGSSLRRILTPNYKVEEHEFSPDYQKIYLICKVIPESKTIPEEHWEKVFLTYDIRQSELNVNEMLNNKIKEAKKIILK